MLQLNFKKTLCSVPPKNSGSGPVSTALTTKWSVKASLKDIFSRKKTKKNDVICIPSTTALTTTDSVVLAIKTTPETYNEISAIEMDPEILKALNDVFEALHDPSILDARRHQRYALFPHVIAETPTTNHFSILDIVQPRCRRSLVLYEIPAGALLSQTPLPIELAPTTTCIEASSSEALIPDAPRVMNIKDIQILRFLGEGTSGKVYYVKDRVTKVKSALKVVPKNDKNEYTLSVVIQERFIAENLSDSPWFVNLWAAWHDDANLYIAMTAYPTDLDSEMIRCGVIEPERARFYMAELIIALTELHSRGIIHRDVKAPNILIDREGHIVLADFGLSKYFGEKPNIAERVYQPYWPYLRDESPTSETEPRDPEELYFVAWDYRGSELEMAPEIHLHQPYAFGVDFWSAAVVLYWMLTGRPPWYEVEDEYEDESDEDVKPLPFKIAEDPVVWDDEDNVNEDTKDFLEKMLAKNPKRRLMISYEMPNHPYFAGLNWTLMEERRVPAPWIPEREVCHAYEPTSPVFQPGTPFPDENSDPYPEFTFVSSQAASRVVVADDGDTESDSDSDASTVTDVEIMYLGSYEDLAPVGAVESVGVHKRGQTENETRTLISSESVREEAVIKEAWDVSIVNRPSIRPCGPGHKLWLSAHDLKGIYLAAPKAAAPVLSLHVQDIGSTSTDTSSSAVALSAPLDACTSLLLQDVHSSLTVDPLPPLADIRREAHKANTKSGVLLKMRTWLTRL